MSSGQANRRRGSSAVFAGKSSRTTHMHSSTKCAYCPDCDFKLPWRDSGFSTCPICGVEFETPGDGTARRVTE